jgi:hypothetical protein
MGEWLADYQGALPPGTLRACFTESHQTRLMNPLADGLRGSRISRMLLTGMVACGFAPMIWSGQEQSDARFIARLLNLWNQQPALRYGTTLFNAVPCDSPQTFAVLRMWQDDRLLSLLNVGPHRQTIVISLPVDTLGLPEGDYALYNLLADGVWDEEGQRCWRRDELLALKLTLEPFDGYCFALQPAASIELHDAHTTVHSDKPPAPPAEAAANGGRELAQAVAADHGRGNGGSSPQRGRRRRADPS